jgi:Tol biopolymer transport system component
MRSTSIPLLLPVLAALGLLATGAAPELPPYASPKRLLEPTLFAEAINSHPSASTPSFSADGRTAYFTIERPAHGMLPPHNVIVKSRFVAGQWTPPAWVEFSGQNQEGNAALSPDGTRLFFWSYRSAAELESPLKQDSDIWFVERDGAGWGMPRRVPPPVNSDARDYMGSIAAGGELYFSSTREGGMGNGDLYVARRSGEDYAPPENLGEAVNSAGNELSPAISPDGQTLVFGSDRAGGFGTWDLYVSFRRNGVWQAAQNLGKRFNTVFRDQQPRFSPDGRYLFFTSDRSGKFQIYQIEAGVLRDAVAAEPHPYASSKPMPEATLFADGAIGQPGCGCITLAPDGKSAFFVMPWANPSRLMLSRFENGRWSKPETASFSGRYYDGDPVFSPDGQKLFFASQRPIDGRDQRFASVWYTERNGAGWSEPRLPAGQPARVGWNGSYASSAADGSLYYFSSGPDAQGNTDIYRVPYANGRYAQRENLGDIVNSQSSEVDPWVAPDQSFLIFANDRPGGLGKQDLYVSVNRRGRWSAPRNLGPLVNSGAHEFCPSMSPDGRYLFFTSDRKDGQPAIYQIDIGILRLAE